MDSFLARQSAGPFDPAPMLILADWLEERGDLIGAGVLRGLAEAGTPSLHALALEATLSPVPWKPDLFMAGDGPGPGSGDASESGHGYGDGFGYGDGSGSGYGDGSRYKDGYGDGFRDGDGRADG